MRVVGITGTIGAGKGTVVEYLMNVKGFAHFSVRGFIVREIKKRRMEVNRNSMVIVANDLRARHNPAYIVEQLYHEAFKTGSDCIIESIRTPGEIEALRRFGNFLLLAVDADPELRYKRISTRGSETDNVDFKTFIEHEAREFNSDNPNHQNLKRCIEMADVVLINNGTIPELHNQIEKHIY